MSGDESPTSGEDRRRLPAGRSFGAWWLLIIVTGVALATDLASKSWAFATVAPDPVVLVRSEVIAATDTPAGPGALLPRHMPVEAVPGLLDLTLVLNRGAVFGIGAGKRWVFVAFTVAAVGFALYGFSRWTHSRQWVVHTAIGLVLGGGLGNLYDRLLYACVRDFLHPLPDAKMPFGLRWPGGSTELWPYVSNVADLYLIIGIVVLVIHVWRTPHEEEAKPKEAGS